MKTKPLITHEERLKLSTNGWVILEKHLSCNYRTSLLDLASVIGKPVPSRIGGSIISELRTVPKELAHPNSLSIRYGSRSFPFHTDTAHWKLPCRFVIMACVEAGEGRRSTLLVPFDNIEVARNELHILRHGLFLVRNGPNSFYASLLDRTVHGETFIRFDSACMTPADDYSNRGLRLISERLKSVDSTRIEWCKGRILLLDNWKIFHARADGIEDSRLLLRISCN